MNLALENIKKNYPILLIKLSIISMFIIVLIRTFIKVSPYLEDGIEADLGIQDLLKVLQGTSFFRPTIILLIPMIGIFINRKIGWILIQSYFYFLISNLVFNMSFMDFIDSARLLIIILGFLLFLWPIIIMNMKKIGNQIYGIGKTELIGVNVITSTIGMGITIVLVFLKANQL